MIKRARGRGMLAAVDIQNISAAYACKFAFPAGRCPFLGDVLREEFFSALNVALAASCACVFAVVPDKPDVGALAFSLSEVEPWAFAWTWHRDCIACKSETVTSLLAPICL